MKVAGKNISPQRALRKRARKVSPLKESTENVDGGDNSKIWVSPCANNVSTEVEEKNGNQKVVEVKSGEEFHVEKEVGGVAT